MRDQGRHARIEHARYVGRSLPPPASSAFLKPVRTLDRRIGGAFAAILVVVVALLAASMVGGGSPRSATAADLATRSAAPTGAIAASSPAAGSNSIDPPAPSTAQPRSPGAAPSLPPGLLPGLPTGYRWPLQIGRITTAFAPEAGGLFIVDGKPFHDGIDIASFCGDHIVAAHDGVVIASGRHVEAALGWVGDVAGYEAHITAKHLWGAQAVMIITDDGNGYRSVYVHLFESLVKVGQHLKAGDLIGYEGRTGDATGCHLHFSIYSPSDSHLFLTDPAVVKRSDLPAAEVARIDPLSVLPAMSTTAITWGWGAKPAASP